MKKEKPETFPLAQENVSGFCNSIRWLKRGDGADRCQENAGQVGCDDGPVFLWLLVPAVDGPQGAVKGSDHGLQKVAFDSMQVADDLRNV